ncbi:hypothetical protein C8Q78DRAFT_1079782 [Trametes maxima]|nr:hypothetical protein C8Q78DRAFT_1079782 [Trametes maxima]
MSYQDQVGGLRLPPAHYVGQDPSSSPASASTGNDTRVPPPLPPRPTAIEVSPAADEGSSSDSGDDAPTPDLGASTSTVNLLTLKDEEELSEIQLRELYDDEEIDRFLHLFSSYVREVRAPGAAASSSVAHAASASAPALSETLPSPAGSTSPAIAPKQTSSDSARSLSERIAVDYFVPILPSPRPPPPEFSLGRLKHTSQRLYVALEPLYSLFAVPLLRLATWKDPKRSFAYCSLYWVLWYHGLLLSALLLCLLYSLTRRKLHPYPSLAELRAHRSRIDRSQTFGTVLSARLVASPALGVKDVWDLFRDYRHTRKLKKAAKASKGHSSDNDLTEADDAASIHSVATERPEENTDAEDVKEEDLKRLGLFLLGEVADLLERVKNFFLWRNPSASVFYGAVLVGWFILGLLPAKYLVRFVGFLVGGFFWHVVPVLAVVPASERSRVPPPLASIPTDAEYAMELISQRVARGLPVRPKRRKHRRHSSDLSVTQSNSGGNVHASESSSVDWNKWGDRLASTKERTGEIKKIFKDGQWKQAGSWKALNPLVPKVATAQHGSETRIETHTFPAQLKQHPGLITLTPTTVFFTPLLSSRATLSIPLADVTGVKKSSLMKGVDVRYSQDGAHQEKEAKFLFVGSRDDLFARLVSWGGKRWTNV